MDLNDLFIIIIVLKPHYLFVCLFNMAKNLKII